MRILMTGGAGYVGSACYRAFRSLGFEVFALDDLSEGNAEAVDAQRLIVADVRDTDAVARTLSDHRIGSVVHFAALTSAQESLVDAERYWSVNLEGTRSLLDAMIDTGVSRLTVSSTASVYAHDALVPIQETSRKAPSTPYGASKFAAEELIHSYAQTQRIGATILRYFNACGADDDAQHGEARKRETHAIPLLLASAMGVRGAFRICGTDWPTPDGTCIRDYVALSDLANAHLLALQSTRAGEMRIYNVGSGKGTSVFELLNRAEAILGRPIPHELAPPRPGDPSALVADIEKIQRELGWRPERSGIEDIIRAAWRWHSTHPKGYGRD